VHIRYKLDVEVIDGDDTGTFIFWDSSLDELFGITATDLLAEMEKVLITSLSYHCY
jgi:PAS domain-containing protein